MSSSLINNSIETSSDNTPIYKVNYLVDGKIDSIFVFFGKIIPDKKEQTELFNTIFTKKEIENIEKNNINIIFSSQQIHLDDTIGVIKLKILSELKNKVSFDEIYLFCQKIENFNAISVYQSLTQNKRLTLTNVRLDQFVSNIVSDENGNQFNKPKQKEIYDYDDIMEIEINNKKFIVNKPLGMKYFIIENEYPFVSNPYKVNAYDSFFEKSSRKTLSTLNSNLLLNSGDILNNNIFLCLAKDVLEFLEKTKESVPEDTTIKIYYPFLYNKNISSLEELISSENKLLEGNKKLLSKKAFENFKTVDMFYDIYKLKKKNLKYLSKGIKYIKILLKPNFTIKIPLEVIFKIIHATETNPLIKYNPSTRQENVYRIYTSDNISVDGRKIPFLKKGIIFKLMKTIGKNKSVAIFVEYSKDNTIYSFICEFDENGYITISSEFDKIVNEREIDNIFRESINPIIEEIKNYLEQIGYKLNLFNSLNDDNVEISQITYETKIEVTKPLLLDSFKGCISSIFINESSEFKSGIHLRYKRVSNFNKMTSQEAFIIEKKKEGYGLADIINTLVENYPDDLTRKDAEELVLKVVNEIRIERGVRKTDIKIKDNPGFKTSIFLEPQTGIITFTVENINDMNYLKTIPIYLDTIIRLTQDEKSTTYPLKEIKKLCSSGEKEDIELPDIISPAESEISHYEEPVLDGEEELKHLKLSDSSPSDIEGEKTKNALNLFFGDEEDEEEEEESDKFGGKPNNSGSSISSMETPDEEESEESEKLLPKLKSLTPSPASSSSKKSKSSVSSMETPEESEESEKSPVKPPSIEIHSEESEESEKSPVKPPSIEIHSEEDSEEEEEQEEQEEEKKQIDKVEPNIYKELDGMSLRNYFQDKIEELDGPLIVKQKIGNYSIYSKVCQSHQRRQPVILSDDELKKINKDLKGFLRPEDVIKYGSDKNNKFNYICPRYWCLKTNTPIDPKDLQEVTENGKKVLKHPTCGKVIPEGDDVVKPGYYIYEFYKPKPSNPNYKRYPSFQVDKHPKGYCLPCCFDKYLTDGRIKAKDKCLDKPVPEKINKKEEEEQQEEQDEYVKGPEKFPLNPGRWGYLPVPIQTMLHEVSADCQISKKNTNVKQNYPCLLRHGVEINNKQSFIACISDAIFFARPQLDDKGKPTGQLSKVLSVQKMKERIIQSLTIDNFIKYQNGNLVTDFFDPNLEVDVKKYEKNNKLFSKINFSIEADVLFFKKVVSAYENFIMFLKDDNVLIDHTYLWDLVSKPNKLLFGVSGINLVILEIPKDDITNNVRLICPTNHYSSEFYEGRKPTLILMKEDDYYEPIYSYKINEKKISVIKLFSEYDVNISKTLKAVFKEIIKPFYKTMCKPLPSMPTEYLAKNPILLYDLIQKLDKYKYKILRLVVNLNGKVIGVVAENPYNLKGFVPCYPAALNDEMKKEKNFTLMTDPTIWNTYDNTYEFLTMLEKRSNKKRSTADIPCKPIFKIVEDEMVVGILTETNQFIQLSSPVPVNEISPNKKLQSIKDNNYIVHKNKTPFKTPMVSSDVIITSSNTYDVERVEYIKKIKLESGFFNVFRNTIKILLNDYENISIREKIENELTKEYVLYSQKLKNINKMLKELVNDKIQFIGDKNYYKVINDVSTCIIKDKDSCKATPNLCAFSENGKCRLILPEKHLITNKLNEPIYYGRVTDEIIRYNRINSFMFQPNAYLTFGNIGYNLRDNEIIIVQSLLNQEYFNNLIPAVVNKYIKYNSYDEAEPIMSQSYDNKISSLDEAIGRNNKKDCQKTLKKNITSSFWKICFPDNFKEIIYGKFIYCTYMFIIDLIEKKTGKKLTINQLKNDLYEEYNKYLQKYHDKIVDILIFEGKKTLGDQVKSETLSFSSFIYTDNYFLTPFDIWMLVKKHKIPTVFISQNPIKILTNNKSRVFVAYGEENDKFSFIVIPGLRSEEVPGYKLIETENEEIFISLNKIKETECFSEIQTSLENKPSVEDFLEKIYKKPIGNIHVNKNKPVIDNTKLVIQDEFDEGDEEVVIATERNEELPIPKVKKTVVESTQKNRVSVKKKGRQPGKKNNNATTKKRGKTIKVDQPDVDIVSDLESD